MRTALHAEWTKLRTLRVTGRLLLGMIALTVAGSAIISAAMACTSSSGCHPDVTKFSVTGVDLGQVIAVVLAVLVVGAEYGTGMMRTTLTAMPRRGTVLVAKAVIVAGATLAAGTVAVLGALLAGNLILSHHGYTPAHGYPALTLTDGPVLRAAAGSVLYLALIALLSLGVATALRDTAASVGVVLGLLYVLPILSMAIADPKWQRHLSRLAPMTAGLEIQVGHGQRHLPIGPWAGLGVLAIWAAGALLAGGLLLRLRDA